MKFYAHSARDSSRKLDRELFQPLAEHLRAVAAEAAVLAVATNLPGLGAHARAAGLLHDLGKYRPEFQQYITVPGSRAKGDPQTYHKQAGAAAAFNGKNNPLALAILGHHGGIPDGSVIPAELKDGPAVADAVRKDSEGDCPELQTALDGLPAVPKGFAADLFTRVLFSCLVDADWADTGEHERKVKNRPPDPEPPHLEPAERLKRVEAHIARLADRKLEPHVKNARTVVLEACLAGAEEKPRLFSLTVPTGGGKTLASLAFALKHAAAHGLRRVIYVAPYMTILEQNADVIREALGVDPADPAVFEHYSLADPGDKGGDETDLASPIRRAENWDAPVVVTTNVQFFESLFSNKPGRCRKLHNIAGSVVILDECQTLPPGLAAPTCGMLRQLATPVADGGLGCSVVLCTATQPAFNHPLLQADERLDAKEIVEKPETLFKALERVELQWPRGNERLTWAEVAKRMAERPAALCVVNTKKAARAVYDELKGRPGVFHLSTGMCPQHRREKLAQVRSLLDVKAPCYVVSTQLIEAGVDVDFPFVMREMAPLESVIQAAGRCNREGKLRDTHGDKAHGLVQVFWSQAAKEEPKKYYPQDEWYTKGRGVLETDFLNDGYEPQIDSPEDIQKYYRKLYQTGRLDKHSIQAKRLEEKYAMIADEYRLIKDDTVPVVVREWDAHRAEIALLLAQIDKEKRPRKVLFRRLAVFQVNVWRRDLARLKPAHISDGPKELLIWTSKYEDSIGIVEEIGWDAIV